MFGLPPIRERSQPALDGSRFEQRFGWAGARPPGYGSAPSLFRLDLPERRNALAPWLDRSIPAIQIASGPDGPLVPIALENFLASLSLGVPAVWDRHYLAFDLGSIQGFWGQQFYLGVTTFCCCSVAFRLRQPRPQQERVLADSLVGTLADACLLRFWISSPLASLGIGFCPPGRPW